MKFWQKHEVAIRFFVSLVFACVLGVGLSGPAWEVYTRQQDLGSGGVGSPAQVNTPIAHSIAEMKTLERFNVQVVQISWDDVEGIYLLDKYFKIVTLDSGERIAMRYNMEADRYDPSKALWESPVGVWRSWVLTDQEQAILNRENLDLSSTDYYADMLGNHESAMTQEEFSISFEILVSLIMLLAFGVAQILWKRCQKRREEITQPKNDLERWLVGTYAIWGQFFADLVMKTNDAAQKGAFHIGAVPRTPETVRHTMEMLDTSWDISNYKELLDTVEYMSAGPGFQNCVDQAGQAWELCRSMQLLGCAYLVGWSDRAEMVSRSCVVGKIIQNTFRSWDELCQGFLDGFASWKLSSGIHLEAAQNAVQRRADIYWAIRVRKDSPYNLPWQMELEPGKYDLSK